MRTTFNKTIFELAKINNKIYLVLADIGYGEIEPFAENFPEDITMLVSLNKI